MKKYLVADLLCGAGGSSTGCERAMVSAQALELANELRRTANSQRLLLTARGHVQSLLRSAADFIEKHNGDL